MSAFVARGRSPLERQILTSIAVYRTTHDYARACGLITPRFLRSRFQNQQIVCRYVAAQAPRRLPRSVRVASVEGDRARVAIREVTGTNSYYLMERLGGVWRIDDIVGRSGIE